MPAFRTVLELAAPENVWLGAQKSPKAKIFMALAAPKV